MAIKITKSRPAYNSIAVAQVASKYVNQLTLLHARLAGVQSNRV
jgi:hypothetical protein